MVYKYTSEEVGYGPKGERPIRATVYIGTTTGRGTVMACCLVTALDRWPSFCDVVGDGGELGVSVLHLCSPRNQVLVQTKRYAVFVITPTMMIDSRFQVQELAGGKRLTVEGRV